MPSIQDLKRAIALSEEIEILKDQLNALLGGDLTSSAPPKRRGRPSLSAGNSEAKPKGKKRKMSPEALEKIRAAQKKRWAKFHREQKAQAKKD